MREQTPDFGHGVRLGFVVSELRRLGEQRRILRDIPAALGLVKRVAGSAVNVVRGSRCASGIHHLRVELFEVFRSELVEPMSPDAGDEVDAYVYLRSEEHTSELQSHVNLV